MNIYLLSLWWLLLLSNSFDILWGKMLKTLLKGPSDHSLKVSIFKWIPANTNELVHDLTFLAVIGRTKFVPWHFITFWSWTTQPNFLSRSTKAEKTIALGTRLCTIHSTLYLNSDTLYFYLPFHYYIILVPKGFH